MTVTSHASHIADAIFFWTLMDLTGVVIIILIVDGYLRRPVGYKAEQDTASRTPMPTLEHSQRSGNPPQISQHSDPRKEIQMSAKKGGPN